MNKISRRSLLKFCAALGVAGALEWTIGPLATPDGEEQDYIEDVSSEEDLIFSTAPMCCCGYFINPSCPVHSEDFREFKERQARREQEDYTDNDGDMEQYNLWQDL